MLDGWYCRSMANEQAAQQEETTEASASEPEESRNQTEVKQSSSPNPESSTQANTNDGSPDYEQQYRFLKNRFKFLIYENEYFQDALRSTQRRLLKVSRDRSFLLDRLLQYEKPDNSSSESDETESSEDEAAKEAKKRKTEPGSSVNGGGGGATRGRKRKGPNTMPRTSPSTSSIPAAPSVKEESPKKELETEDQTMPGHMTPAEVEKHLQSRQTVMELIPERTPATVPAEMFSNEHSLDSDNNEHHILGENSPPQVAAEECVEYCN